MLLQSRFKLSLELWNLQVSKNLFLIKLKKKLFLHWLLITFDLRVTTTGKHSLTHKYSLNSFFFFCSSFQPWAFNSLRHLHSTIYFAKNQQLQTTTQHHLFCCCLQSPAFPSHDDEVITTHCLSNISTGTNPEKNIVRMQGKTWQTWK